MTRHDPEWMLNAVRALPAGYRPSKDEWSMTTALAVSTRGECSRRKVGAVVIDRNGRIAGAGYNGSEPGGPSCLKGECPRALSGVLPGSSYDTGPGACHAVHAELNAILDVSDGNRLNGATLFVTAEPCDGCLRILRTKALHRIVFLDESGVAWSISHPFRRG